MTGLYTDLFIGILAIVIGYATIKYDLGRYIIFVNEKKYDTKKVGKTAGVYIMAYGFIDIILLAARFITQGSKVGNALDKASIVIIFIIGALMYYKITKTCKIEIKEEKITNFNPKKKKKKKKKKRK